MRLLKGFEDPLIKPLPSPLRDPLGMGGGGLNYACFNFTGSNYATIAALSSNLIGGGGGWTFSLRINPSAYGGSNQCVFDFFGEEQNAHKLNFPRSAYQYGSHLTVVAGSDKSASMPNLVATVGAYSIVTLTRNSSDNKVRGYLNGVLKYTSGDLGAFGAVATTTLAIGAQANGSNKSVSRVADIRIYSAVVTPDHTIPATEESNLVAWYPYPDAAGNARDASGNGNHMTTTGGTLYSATGGPGLPWVTLP